MTIIERLRQYKELEPHKIALIIDDTKYTYSEPVSYTHLTLPTKLEV